MIKRAFVLLLLAPLMMAQGHSPQLSRTAVSGFVRLHGHPVADAEVTARSHADRQTTKTDKDGHYIIFSLPSGSYQVSAVHGGDKTCAPAHIQMEAGYKYEVNLNMDSHCGM